MTRRRRLLLIVLAVLLALAAALAWLLGTTAGLRLVLTRAERATGGALTVQQAQGRLAGTVTLDGLSYRTGDGLAVRVAHLDAQPALLALLRGRVRLHALDARALDVALPPSETRTARTSSAWPDLRAPVDLFLDRVRLDGLRVHRGDQDLFVADRINFDGAWTAQGVALQSLQLRAPDGSVDLDARMAFAGGHPGQVDGRFDWQWEGRRWTGSLKARGNGRTATADLALTRPSTARAHLSLKTRAPYAWQARLDLPRGAAAPWLGDSAIQQLAATVQAHGDRDQLHAQGTFDLDARRLQLAALDARFDQSYQIIALQHLQLRSPQHAGSLDASGRIDLTPATPTAQLRVAWQGVSVPAALAGRDLATAGTLKLDGTLKQYRAELTAQAGAPDAPVTITASAQGTPERIEVPSLAVTRGKGRLDASGAVDLGADMAWRASATTRAFDPGSVLPGWPGSLDARLQAQGRAAGKAVQATLDLQQLSGTLRGRTVRGHGRVSLSPQRVLEGRLELDYGEDRLALDGKAGARNDITLRAHIGALGAWLPDARGALDADLRLRGRWPQLALKGSVNGARLDWRDMRARRLSSRLDVTDIAHPGGSLHLHAEELHAAGFTFDRLDLDASGNRDRHQLAIKATGDPLSLALSLDGGLRGPAWNGRLTRLDLDLARQPAWHLRAPATLRWDRGQAELAQTCLQAGAPQLCLSGERQRNGALHARYRMRQLPLALVLALTANDLPMRARGTLDGDGDIHIGAAGALSGQASLRSDQGTLFYVDQPGQPLLRYRALDARLDLGAQAQTLKVAAQLQDNGRLDGNLSMHGDQHQLGGRLRMHLDSLRFVELFVPQLANLEGTLDADLTPAGTLARPVLRGEAHVDKLAAEVPTLGLTLDQGRLRISGDDTQSLHIDGQLRSGKGTLKISGSAGIGAGQPTLLAVQGSNVQVANIPSAAVSLSPDIGIQRDADGLHLAGVVRVDSARVELEKLPGAGTTQASPDVVVVDAGKPAAPPAAALPVTSNLRVLLGDHAHVTGYGLDGDLHGDLLVIGRPGKGAVGQGQIRIDGNFRAYSQNLAIERGRLLFASTPLDDPGLDIRAVRKLNPNATVSDGQEVGLQVRGTARRPVLTVFSNPAMAQSDALSYLITGKPLSQVQGGEGSMVNSAARALGSATGDLLAKNVGSRLGISDIGVSNNDALGTAAFTVGKYLSPRLYLSYGVGLFEPGQVVTLRYILSRRWNFEAQQSTNASRASFNYRYER